MPRRQAAYRRTPDFDETSTPEALRKQHSTKPGVWGLIHVCEGALEYHVHEPTPESQRLTPGQPGIVLPEVSHHVETPEPVRFYIEFWRAPAS